MADTEEPDSTEPESPVESVESVAPAEPQAADESHVAGEPEPSGETLAAELPVPDEHAVTGVPDAASEPTEPAPEAAMPESSDADQLPEPITVADTVASTEPESPTAPIPSDVEAETTTVTAEGAEVEQPAEQAVAVSEDTAVVPTPDDTSAAPDSPDSTATLPTASYDQSGPLVDKRGIEVSEVSRRFGKVRAVSNASFYAAPGRVTALIGPNGSGKTTLLLMLASLLKPTSGTITINGLDPSVNTHQLREIIGWMPDSIGVWPTLTVRRTLRTVGRMYGLSGRTAKKRADELIELTGLSEFRDRPARVLSRGQKQKLSLARALVNDPDVLLLDEPASGLDPASRIELREMLRELAGRRKTILISSHVLAELDQIADDAVYLTDGVTATTEQVKRASESRRPWRLTVLDPALVNSALTDLGLSYTGTDSDRDIEIPIESDADAANVLRELVTRGVPVVAFQPAVGRLEHTFLDLNRGE